MMPYLVQVLRDALGPAGQDVRLGNVSCVSSRRGWWTQDLKEQVWTRGGGGWMVGKVNVGKSRLFESIYPKGRNQHVGFESLRVAAGRGTVGSDEADDLEVQRFAQTSLASGTDTDPKGQSDAFDETSLLPPSPSEVAYPVMPIVSPLPGTTASPIRLPFGDGKGELIDLPGLSRGDLDTYVRPEHRLDLVMCKRLKPAQHVLKPGQSLLLGGLIRITPTTPDMIVMAYPFVPLDAHVTSTTKAREIQRQERDSGVSTIVRPGVGETMNSAGVFELRWDVTKQRSGPLTRSDAAGLKADRLPYCVLSTDILVEGVGWVELVAQVRRKMSQGESQRYPAVEVFSPDGEYIGQRRPMNAWLYSAEGPRSSEKKSRPRPSMKGRKKGMKGAKRMPEI
ncbi:MAG: hypothetical protein M1838_002209 [Thelocarpon superellum]|nr:MAG: hypothetical protein M1838_002209 [Thelocarpon superellum]